MIPITGSQPSQSLLERTFAHAIKFPADDFFIQQVSQLISQGAVGKNYQDKNGHTALIRLIRSQYPTDVIQLLLEHDCSTINEKDKYGDTALMYAVARDTELAQVLLRFGAKPNLANNKRSTPLMKAVLKENIPMVKLLLEQNDIDINSKDREGKTALMFAVSPEMISLLLEHGALVTVQDKSGRTALYYRLSHRYRDDDYERLEKIVALFVQRGAYTTSKEGSVFRFLAKDPDKAPLILQIPLLPEIDEDQLAEERRLLTTMLMSIKRVAPSLPKDIQYFILRSSDNMRNAYALVLLDTVLQGKMLDAHNKSFLIQYLVDYAKREIQEFVPEAVRDQLTINDEQMKDLYSTWLDTIQEQHEESSANNEIARSSPIIYRSDS